MLSSKIKIQNLRFIFCILHFAFCISIVAAQSTNSSYPTAVTTNEISGTIKARDVGDGRLTSYYYTFNGNQGDIFLNVVTGNFNGDIDIFNADGLRPLSKIVIYADTSEIETGRVIYLRKPEKLILRIEGRTPNDDAGTFKIKFAGSFVAVSNAGEQEIPPVPEVKSSNQTDIRVNSVGTIIEVLPKTTAPPKETTARNTEAENAVREISIQTADDNAVIADTGASKKNDTKIEIAEDSTKKAAEVVITDNALKSADAASTTTESVSPTETAAENPAEIVADSKAKPTKSVAKTRTPPKPKKTKVEKPIEANPLENVRLIVVFKDGKKIERAMSDVLKVGVDKGVLTIISKDGAIGRYSILDVAKMTIE